MTDDVLRLRIVAILKETADTHTLVLETLDGRPVVYRSGQFLTFLLTIAGHESRRSYSISSAPGEPLSVTIKRVENGAISRYLLDYLRVGDVLTTLPPAGRFTLDPAPATGRDVVLIGAGSGITPLFSILKDILRHEPNSRVSLLDANTRERSIIFRDQLDALQRDYADRFRLIHVLSQPSDQWTGRRGRLNNVLLESLLPALLPSGATLGSIRFYVCGPFEFMRMVTVTLLFEGVRAEQIRRENFVTTPIVTNSPSGSSHPELAKSHHINVRFRGTKYKLDVPPYHSILQAALDHGIRLPYSCRGGRCSTCIAQLRSGSVQMTINDVLTERDLSEGWILTCTGYPTSADVSIDL